MPRPDTASRGPCTTPSRMASRTWMSKNSRSPLSLAVVTPDSRSARRPCNPASTCCTAGSPICVLMSPVRWLIPRCVCRSKRPGRIVASPKSRTSTTSAARGAHSLSIRVMRSPSTRTATGRAPQPVSPSHRQDARIRNPIARLSPCRAPPWVAPGRSTTKVQTTISQPSQRLHAGALPAGSRRHSGGSAPERRRDRGTADGLHRQKRADASSVRSRYEITWPCVVISLRLLRPLQNFSGQVIL